MNMFNFSKHFEISSIDRNESVKIDKKVDSELNKILLKMIRIGGTANFLSGILVVLILSNYIPLSLLIKWATTLFILNAINIFYAFYYEHSLSHAQGVISKSNIYHFILAALCITWGSMYVLFASHNPLYQLYTTVFLLAVLLGFSFGSMPDFISSIISIICLLAPYMAFHIYFGVRSIALGNYDPNLHFGFAACLLILGIFMLVACYIGNRLIKKFLQLNFINVVLNKKLENANQFLEDRVKERTIELEKSLELVKYQATHDLLTNLPNHAYLVDAIETAIKTANTNNSLFCVIFFSLNEIDKINDGLGHRASTFTIQTITERLRKIFKVSLKNVRYTITLSRRDEFVILLEYIRSFEEIEPLAEKIFSILEESVAIEKVALKLTGSIGISIYPRDGKNTISLLMNADAAMVSSKQWGGNKLSIYTAEINADLSNQLNLSSHLSDALKNNEFKLYYQPFIDLSTGKICGAEALIRWESPIFGLVSPTNFIYLAESNGMIIPLGEWVLRTACKQTKIWHNEGFTSFKMAINLSAKQLQQKNIIEVVADILKKINLDPKHIELELTETEAFKEEAIPVLKQFKKMGLCLSIDDFGTGYSGLKNLKLFSIDKLKIDKAFVQDINKNIESKKIVENIITLGKTMGINVLAEGVETKEELDFLRKSGCNMIQGYYFSPPIPADDFTEILLSKQGLFLDIVGNFHGEN